MPNEIVVVGAGFAGLTAARHLAKRAAAQNLHVTVVDRHNHHTFQPLLYQVATAGLQPQDIGHSVRGIFGLRGPQSRRGVSFRMGDVVAVDWERRRLEFREGDPLPFDYLVVAAGATTADYGIDGVEEHGWPLKSITEATALRNHILGQFERVESGAAGPGTLRFVIAGGGPTGVELAGALAELVDMVLSKDHPELDLSKVEIVLVEMLDTLLPPYTPKSQAYAREALEARGIEVRTGTAIARVEPGKVVFEGGDELETDTLIWTAGVRAAALADTLGLEQTQGGRVEVHPHLEAKGRARVFVIGDMAAARDPDGEVYPQLAPVAIQQGKHVARQISRHLEGRRPSRFVYLDKGIMATIGRNDAVVELPVGLRYGGFPAWLSWLFLHLFYLVGFRNRIAVFLQWMWNYLTYDRSARLILDHRHREDVEDERLPDEPREPARTA